MKTGRDDIDLPDRISRAIGKDVDAWLVGGSVRDLCMGRGRARDLDIAVRLDAGHAAGRISGALGCSWFAMDAKRGMYRVSCPRSDLQVDISSVHGDIRDDLARRDFTMNAMALPLGSKRLPEDVIDPHGGLSDIGTGTIRALCRDAISDDPLRLLRAFRFEASLGFEIGPETLTWIKELAPDISRVSPERVRDELYLVLETPAPSDTFRRMHSCGLLGGVLPEVSDMREVPQPPPHEHGLLEHAFRAMYHAEHITSGKGLGQLGGHAGAVEEVLGGVVETPLTMRGLTVLAAFLHDIGKPPTMTDEAGRTRFIGHDAVGADMAAMLGMRLRMASRVCGVLEKTTRHHMRPLMLSRRGTSRRALYRLARDAGEAYIPLMLVALADAMATRERPDSLVSDVEGLVYGALGYYLEDYTRARTAPLLRGRDLVEELGLVPGPVFRRILDDVECARADGDLTERDAAIEYVRSNMDRYRG